jgi:hypothetical protein
MFLPSIRHVSPPANRPFPRGGTLLATCPVFGGHLTSTTISATLAPNVTQSQAYAYLKDTARKMLPAGYSTDTVGSLRQFVRLPILSVEVNDFDQSINRSAIGCSG